ncbi:MAG: conserved phage C-terminal domain-containing protein [Candidatus Peribacteraceae bacterium]|nr:conserved phage C-terminal domain-containing protein [Candidatus Peribacteraceae bacterium]
MALQFRKRFISIGAYQNKTLDELGDTCFRLFTGLWCLADREGLLEDNPDLIRAMLFPYRPSLKIDHWLQELHKSSLIYRYELDRDNYLLIPNFKRYQTIHPHEASSVIPISDEIYANVIKCNDMSLHCKSNSKSSNKSKSKDKDQIPYESIINDLNKRAGTKYRATTPKTKELIRLRWNEGFRLNDFEIVHRKKVEQWLDKPDYVQYLRPETLYGTKFESYLNQQGSRKKDGKDKRITQQEFKEKYLDSEE